MEEEPTLCDIGIVLRITSALKYKFTRPEITINLSLNIGEFDL